MSCCGCLFERDAMHGCQAPEHNGVTTHRKFDSNVKWFDNNEAEQAWQDTVGEAGGTSYTHHSSTHCSALPSNVDNLPMGPHLFFRALCGCVQGCVDSHTLLCI